VDAAQAATAALNPGFTDFRAVEPCAIVGPLQARALPAFATYNSKVRPLS